MTRALSADVVTVATVARNGFGRPKSFVSVKNPLRRNGLAGSNRSWVSARILSALLAWTTLNGASFTQTEVFRAGEGGYDTYRIPALISSAKGTLLAFCEGRRNSASDSGDIDVLLRRSFDGGKTWAPVQTVADAGGDTIGNPAPVVDRKSGSI